MNNCSECKFAYKRSSFDLRKYGSYGFPYECLKERIMYVSGSDVCEHFVKRENGDNK